MNDLLNRRRGMMISKGDPDPYKPVVITQNSTTGSQLASTLAASGIDKNTHIALRKTPVNLAIDYAVLSALKNTFARSRTNGAINNMSEYSGSYGAIIDKGEQFYSADPGDLDFANAHCSVVYSPSKVTNGANLKTAISAMLANLESGRYIVYAVKPISKWANQDFIIGIVYSGELRGAHRWTGSQLQGYDLSSTWSFKIAAGDPIAFYRINDI